ncbi:hypothetical protein [Actinoplanes nipponensis]|uniref:hypothetical protein n=1 Tax=Actinoplanes nipponensis TaxID=135950 RepID=UPI0031EDD133
MAQSLVVGRRVVAATICAYVKKEQKNTQKKTPKQKNTPHNPTPSGIRAAVERHAEHRLRAGRPRLFQKLTLAIDQS